MKDELALLLENWCSGKYDDEASFFADLLSLAQPPRERQDPHFGSMVKLWAARKKLEQRGQKPTWTQVVETVWPDLHSRPSESTRKRIRRKLNWDLPDPPRGKAKKTGQRR